MPKTSFPQPLPLREQERRARAIHHFADLDIPPVKAVELGDKKLTDGLDALSRKAAAQKRSGPLDLRGRLASAAAAGQFGDKRLGHLTEGEIVVPRSVLGDELRAKLAQPFRDAGAEPGRYIVGGPDDSINPATGQPEFYWRSEKDLNDFETGDGEEDERDSNEGDPEDGVTDGSEIRDTTQIERENEDGSTATVPLDLLSRMSREELEGLGITPETTIWHKLFIKPQDWYNKSQKKFDDATGYERHQPKHYPQGTR